MSVSSSENNKEPSTPSISSSSSRVVRIKETNILLLVTVLFVFSTILFSPLVNLLLLAGFTIFIGIVFYYWKSPNVFPKWLDKYPEKCLYRIKIFPYEFIMVIGVFYLVISRAMNLHHGEEKWYHVSNCLLLIIAYYLTDLGNRAAYTGCRGMRIFWELSIKPIFARKMRRDASVDLESAYDQENAIMPEKGHFPQDLLSSNKEQQAWRKNQHERWEKWIRDEMNRMKGGSFTDDQND